MKAIIFWMSLAGCVGTLSAQSLSLKVGPRIGLNVANVTVNGFKDNALVRFHIGVFGTVSIRNKFEAQAELLYAQQGTNQLGTLTGPITHQFINIPLLIKFSPISALNVHAGPQVGIFLSSKFKSADTGKVYNASHVNHKIDLAWMFGAEYEVIEHLHAGLRYTFSLLDTHTDDDRVAKSQVFQITVAYDLHERSLTNR